MPASIEDLSPLSLTELETRLREHVMSRDPYGQSARTKALAAELLRRRVPA